MRQTSVINDLLNAISDSVLFGDRRKAKRAEARPQQVIQMMDELLEGRGEFSALEQGSEALREYRDLDVKGRIDVLRSLAVDYGPDRTKLRQAAQRFLDAGDDEAARTVQFAAEPRRMELFRRLNQVKGGTEALVAMRLELIENKDKIPELRQVDHDLKELFRAWFNRGFLELRSIDWNTSAAILEKIQRYEAVHEIHDWDDLRRRIDVPDRRLYGFFHPRLGDEPLIFVEIALTKGMSRAIGPILATHRPPLAAEEADTAVFYSISNCQDGLRGISFGAFLIKQVAQNLAAELPNIRHFVTLSPMPRFAAWLASADGAAALSKEANGVVRRLADPHWLDDAEFAKEAEAVLVPAAAHYLAVAKDKSGRAYDPVARFHLGNGARLQQINFAANTNPAGLKASHGVMVNYSYVLTEVEDNHEAFANEGTVAMSPAIQKLLRQFKGSTGSHLPAANTRSDQVEPT